MDDINFRQIAPRSGGQREAFEELCCQLEHRSLKEEINYTRLYGAGGDGGVECFADFPDETRVGWQAKYVFNVDSLIRQVDISLSTALKIHSTLTRYIICFPINLTGPTGRRGRSGYEKFKDWQKIRENEAANQGRIFSVKLPDLLSNVSLTHPITNIQLSRAFQISNLGEPYPLSRIFLLCEPILYTKYAQVWNGPCFFYH